MQNIIGHNFQRKQLHNSVLKDRLSHAYIFSGPEGIGKKLVSIEFAKFINCKELKTADSSDLNEFNCSCSSCKKILNNTHPDVHIFNFENSKIIKIDQVRDNIEKLIYLAPYESNYKVFIINDAERMNFNSQNAFLKSLEEPPKNSIIILVTSLIDLIIPTILSRCQHINFMGLKNSDVESYLAENSKHDPDQINLISRISKGSIGKAKKIDSDFLDIRKDFIKEITNIDKTKPNSLFNLSEKIHNQTKSNNLENINQFFDIITLLISDCINVKIGRRENKIINMDLLEEIKKFSANKNTNQLIEIFNFVEDTHINILRHNANKQLSFDNLLLKMAE
ncbi:MAG: AAA family ATPase [Candidatus Dadabacteria bacterium]|nr:AAA family ATPase [Candidatus Dadabacteria bacterium]NIQ14988.1 AAA family ATPase [Candidatus Dadabacteria bacterium]